MEYQIISEYNRTCHPWYFEFKQYIFYRVAKLRESIRYLNQSTARLKKITLQSAQYSIQIHAAKSQFVKFDSFCSTLYRLNVERMCSTAYTYNVLNTITATSSAPLCTTDMITKSSIYSSSLIDIHRLIYLSMDRHFDRKINRQVDKYICA